MELAYKRRPDKLRSSPGQSNEPIPSYDPSGHLSIDQPSPDASTGALFPLGR